MNGPPPLDDDDVLRANINAETGKIAWKSLQRYFAAGRAVQVSPGLDLVEVAFVITRDRHETLDAWMKVGRVALVSDAQAREWVAANALMWSVVVKPWVLVQPVLRDPDSADPPA